MAGNKRQKKSSGSGGFGLFNFFKGKSSSSRPQKGSEDVREYNSVKYYKVWPSDEDRGRYVAEPGIDRMAHAYIISTKTRWNEVAVSN